MPRPNKYREYIQIKQDILTLEKSVQNLREFINKLDQDCTKLENEMTGKEILQYLKEEKNAATNS